MEGGDYKERDVTGGCTWAERVPGPCPRLMLTVEKGGFVRGWERRRCTEVQGLPNVDRSPRRAGSGARTGLVLTWLRRRHLQLLPAPSGKLASLSEFPGSSHRKSETVLVHLCLLSPSLLEKSSEGVAWAVCRVCGWSV